MLRILLIFIFFVNCIFPDYQSMAEVLSSATSSSSSISKNLSVLDQLKQLKLSDVTLSKTKEGQNKDSLLILIRDLHCQEEAQINIAKTLEVFQKELGLKNVFMEGAEGEFDLELLKAFPDFKVRDKVGLEFLKEGYLTGAEYAGLRGGFQNSLDLYGIEESTLYIENLQAFLKVRRLSKELSSETNKIDEQIKNIIEKSYSQEMKELFGLQKNLKENDMKLDEALMQLEALLQKHGQKLDGNLERMLEVLKTSKTIQSEKIQSDLKKLLDELSHQLKNEELKSMVKWSLEYRLGRMGILEYLTHLKEAYERDSRVSLEKNYSTLWDYYQLQVRQEKLKSESVYEELEQKINILMVELAKALGVVEEESVVREWGLVKDLIALKATRKELENIKKYMSSRLGSNSMDIGQKPLLFFERSEAKSGFSSPRGTRNAQQESSHTSLNNISILINESLHFYDLALTRDQVMTQNALERSKERMTHNTSSITVLITGGFHTEGIEKILDEKGISYAVVIPNMHGKVDESIYEKRMQGPYDFEQTEFSQKKLAAHERTEDGKWTLTPAALYGGILKRFAAGRYEQTDTDLLAQIWMNVQGNIKDTLDQWARVLEKLSLEQVTSLIDSLKKSHPDTIVTQFFKELEKLRGKVGVTAEITQELIKRYGKSQPGLVKLAEAWLNKQTTPVKKDSRNSVINRIGCFVIFLAAVACFIFMTNPNTPPPQLRAPPVDASSAAANAFAHVRDAATEGGTIRLPSTRPQTPEQLNELVNHLLWHGESSFRFQVGDKTVYIDPYWLNDNDSSHPADIIFITHDHYDHCSRQYLPLISRPNTIFVGPQDVADRLRQIDAGAHDIRVIRPGDRMEIEGIKIRAVRAYTFASPDHPSWQPTHPREKNWVGYVIETPDGRRIYHAGDTDFIPEMQELANDHLDVALLPVGGHRFTMGPQEAAQAAMAIRPAVAVPMHYSTEVETLQEEAAGEFANRLHDGPVPVRILLPLWILIPPPDFRPGDAQHYEQRFRSALGVTDPTVILRQNPSDAGAMQKPIGSEIKEINFETKVKEKGIEKFPAIENASGLAETLKLGKQAQVKIFKDAFPNFERDVVLVQRLMRGENIQEVLAELAQQSGRSPPAERIEFHTIPESEIIRDEQGSPIQAGSYIENGTLHVFLTPDNAIGAFHEIYEKLILPLKKDIPEGNPNNIYHTLAALAETGFEDGFVTRRFKEQVQAMSPEALKSFIDAHDRVKKEIARKFSVDDSRLMYALAHAEVLHSVVKEKLFPTTTAKKDSKGGTTNRSLSIGCLAVIFAFAAICIAFMFIGSSNTPPPQLRAPPTAADTFAHVRDAASEVIQLPPTRPRTPEELLDLLRSWHGESSFRFTIGEKTVYIDPFGLPESERSHPADIIFITHEHFDHYAPEDIRKISTSRTIFVAPQDVAHLLTEAGARNVHAVSPEDRLEIDGIRIRAVRAYTSTVSPDNPAPTHPREKNWVGYIIETPDGRRIYHAGDTELISEMQALSGQVDIAFLPVGGMEATMDPQQAAEAAAIIRPRVAVPMHYGTLSRDQTLGEEAATQFEGLLHGTVPTRILRRGTSEQGAMQKGGGDLKEVVETGSKPGKGVLIPSYWLAQKIAPLIDWMRQSKNRPKLSKDEIEDFIVPVIEEGILAVAFLFGPWAYVAARILFVVAHAFQDYAPPEGEKRTLFEKMILPFYMSIGACLPLVILCIIPVFPAYCVLLTLFTYFFSVGFGLYMHIESNRFVTLTGSRYQKGVLSKKNLEALKLDEIACSQAGLKGIFKNPSKWASEINSKLDEKAQGANEVVLGEGKDAVHLIKRKNGRNTVWSFRKEDLEKIKKIFGIKDLEELKPNEVAVSGPGLGDIFIVGDKKVDQFGERFNLPDIDGKEIEYVYKGELDSAPIQIIFRKRDAGGRIVWAFDWRSDEAPRDAIAKIAGLEIKNEKIEPIKFNEVAVSKPGLGNIFVGGTEKVNQFRERFKLPDMKGKETEHIYEGELDKKKIRVKFIKRTSGRSTIVWAFDWRSDESPREVIAKIAGLEIKNEKIESIKPNEVAVSLYDLEDIFWGGRRKTDQFRERFNLPDIDGKEIEYVYEGELDSAPIQIIFRKRDAGGGRIVWAFDWRSDEAPREAIAKIAGLEIRNEKIEPIKSNEVAVSGPGLGDIFVGGTEKVNQFRERFNLPDIDGKEIEYVYEGELDSAPIQIIFRKRDAGGGRIVWAFDWRSDEAPRDAIARIVGLEIKNEAEALDDQIEQLDLADAIALLGNDPLRFSQYLRLYHPELAPDEVSDIVSQSVAGLGGRVAEEEELHEDFSESLPAVALNPTPTVSSGSSFALSGRASPGVSYVQVTGAYTCKIRVREDGTFQANIPLPRIGELNEFEIYEVKEENKEKGAPVSIQIEQTGTREDTQEVFLKLLALKEDILESIQQNPARYAFLLRATEQSLLGDFTENEEEGFNRLSSRIASEKSSAMRKILQAIEKKFKAIKDMPIKLKNGEKLYFFQKYCIYEARALRKEGAKGVIIANEQGLGKTITALVLINGEEATIITPNSVVSAWLEQEAQFIPEARLEAIEGSYAEREAELKTRNKAQVVTNVEFTRGMTPARAKLLSRSTLIVDEAAYLGGRDSQQAKGTRQIDAQYKVLLTATPFKRISQIAELLSFILPDDARFKSAKAFAEAFPADSPESMNALFLLLQQHTIRVRKKDVFKEYDPDLPIEGQKDRLPRKVEVNPETEMGQFELNLAQCASILELFTDYEGWCQKHKGSESDDDKTFHRYKEGYFSKKEALRQIMNDPKYIGIDQPSPKHQMMDEIVKKELQAEGKTNKKMVIFCRYKAEVEEYLKRYAPLGARAYYGGLKSDRNGYRIDDANNVLYYQVDEYGNYVLDTQGTPIQTTKEQGKPIRALDYERILFQNNPDARVLIATYDSGSVGVTFTAADVMVDDDLAPTYPDQYQADDRAHRIDNKRPKKEIRYYRLQAIYPESFLASLDQKTRDTYFGMGTYDQVHTLNLARQGRIFHRVVDGVGSDEELTTASQQFMKEKMPFMFGAKQVDEEEQIEEGEEGSQPEVVTPGGALKDVGEPQDNDQQTWTEGEAKVDRDSLVVATQALVKNRTPQNMFIGLGAQRQTITYHVIEFNDDPNGTDEDAPSVFARKYGLRNAFHFLDAGIGSKGEKISYVYISKNMLDRSFYGAHEIAEITLKRLIPGLSQKEAHRLAWQLQILGHPSWVVPNSKLPIFLEMQIKGMTLPQLKAIVASKRNSNARAEHHDLLQKHFGTVQMFFPKEMGVRDFDEALKRVKTFEAKVQERADSELKAKVPDIKGGSMAPAVEDEEAEIERISDENVRDILAIEEVNAGMFSSSVSIDKSGRVVRGGSYFVDISITMKPIGEGPLYSIFRNRLPTELELARRVLIKTEKKLNQENSSHHWEIRIRRHIAQNIFDNPEYLVLENLVPSLIERVKLREISFSFLFRVSELIAEELAKKVVYYGKQNKGELTQEIYQYLMGFIPKREEDESKDAFEAKKRLLKNEFNEYLPLIQNIGPKLGESTGEFLSTSLPKLRAWLAVYPDIGVRRAILDKLIEIFGNVAGKTVPDFWIYGLPSLVEIFSVEIKVGAKTERSDNSLLFEEILPALTVDIPEGRADALNLLTYIMQVRVLSCPLRTITAINSIIKNELLRIAALSSDERLDGLRDFATAVRREKPRYTPLSEAGWRRAVSGNQATSGVGGSFAQGFVSDETVGQDLRPALTKIAPTKETQVVGRTVSVVFNRLGELAEKGEEASSLDQALQDYITTDAYRDLDPTVKSDLERMRLLALGDQAFVALGNPQQNEDGISFAHMGYQGKAMVPSIVSSLLPTIYIGRDALEYLASDEKRAYFLNTLLKIEVERYRWRERNNYAKDERTTQQVAKVAGVTALELENLNKALAKALAIQLLNIKKLDITQLAETVEAASRETEGRPRRMIMNGQEIGMLNHYWVEAVAEVLDEKLKGLEKEEEAIRTIRKVMNLAQEERVVFIVNTPFEQSNNAVINFLNSGRGNIVALKGPAGVFNEFYFDGHPKAVNVADAALAEAGIEMPEDGVLDPSSWSEPEKSVLKEKIKALKSKVGLPLEEVERLERKKFETLQDRKKVKIDNDLTVYANCHIFDLRVRDKLGKERVIRTYQNSPVIAEGVEILGVGPETIEKWGIIIKSSKGVIILGDTTPFAGVLSETVENQERLTIEASEALSNPSTWVYGENPAIRAVREVRQKIVGVQQNLQDRTIDSLAKIIWSRLEGDSESIELNMSNGEVKIFQKMTTSGSIIPNTPVPVTTDQRQLICQMIARFSYSRSVDINLKKENIKSQEDLKKALEKYLLPPVSQGQDEIGRERIAYQYAETMA